MTRLLLKLLEGWEGIDVARLGIVDAAENPPAAEAELAVETLFSNTEAVALAVSRLMGRFSFCKLRNFRRITLQEQRE
jgi:hypothetical protein